MKQVIQDNIWGQRIPSANRYYEEWEKLFKCDILDKYYEGIQWKSQRELGYDPYVINKFYETVQIKVAQFMPTFPGFQVTAYPGNSDQNITSAAASSQLKGDILNTIIQDPHTNFAEEIEMAYIDSFFRFGMIEVNYSAEWIDNPNAQKPLLQRDVDSTKNNRSKIIDEPSKLPVNERVYYKHIGAKRFRVGGIDNKYLNRCGWVGYYEWVYRDDLLSLKIMNRDKVESASSIVPRDETLVIDRDADRLQLGALKIWKLWDLKAKVHVIILDAPCVTIFQKSFKRLPLFDLRPNRRIKTEGFYPMPPAFSWLSPQNEINETREQLRAHRRRFIRKFQVMEGQIDDEEIEKFETGPDGALVKVKTLNAITPITNADLGSATNEAMATSADDLNRISGTADEDRGVADRTTATQANIVNAKSALRENKERDRVVRWMSHIGRETLLIVRDRFTGKLLVKMTSPEGEAFLGNVGQNEAIYDFVTSEDLDDGYDFRVDVDITSLSTASQQLEKQKMLEFLSILNQYPMVAFSPYLVREIAYRTGYRNEKAIGELQKMALLMELGRMQQLQGQIQQPLPQGGPAGQQITQQATPPDMEKIRNQLTNQLGQTGPVQ